MRIGIDISQVAYEGTGVGNYVRNLVENLVNLDKKNEYILFFSSLRKDFQFSIFNFQSDPKIQIKQYKFPPTLLDLFWNKLHIFPIEWFIGEVDVFISSDWTQPPMKAKNVTILYDLIVYRHPNESTQKIVDVQRRKLAWVKKECDKVLCISEATKQDAVEILKIPENKLEVVYPGI